MKTDKKRIIKRFLLIILSLLISCGKDTNTNTNVINIGNNITDTEAPQCTVKINNGDSATDSIDVTLSLSAADDTGVTGYYISESSSIPSLTGSGWVLTYPMKSYSVTVSYSLSSGSGTKTVYVWFRDDADRISTAASDNITFSSSDTTAPSNPSVSINSGDTSTTSTIVTLILSASDDIGVTGYCAKESSITPSYNDSCWTSITSTTSYSATVNFTLSSGSLGDNTKTVYVWFRDTAGNISSSASGSITLTAADTTSTWTTGASMPTARYWAASAVVDSSIYVIGGGGGTTYYKVERYDTVTNSWTSLPNWTSGSFLIRGATVNGLIYIFGGGYSSKSVYRYDPSSGSWTRLNDMPYQDWMGDPTVVNNKVYIFGGEDSSGNVVATTLEYNPATDTWTTKASMPTAGYAPATAIYNNKIYVLGGNYRNDKNEVYDPATNTWETKASIPFRSYGWCVAGEIGGKIYFVDSDTYSTPGKMGIYSPLTNTWESATGLAVPRDYLTGEVVNGQLYVIGGKESGVSSSRVDIYTPSTTGASKPTIYNGYLEDTTDYSDFYKEKHLKDVEAIHKYN